MQKTTLSAKLSTSEPTTHIGPLMVDVAGLVLSEEDRQLLSNPLVGGLILFTRNYSSLDQLSALIADIRACNPTILIAVDHEGGRVQRFREGFTRIPAMRVFGDLYASTPTKAIALAKECGWLFASELRAFDIDFSFAPVLDLDYGVSSVIGDRAFSGDVTVVANLASALIEGMAEAGMASTGKHFPGHGAIEADSHVALPVDNRPFCDIETRDIEPFKQLMKNGLNAVMPAHVIYSDCDESPAGFSSFWLNDILRTKLSFDGVIFSDDLTMEGASVAGSYAGRVKAALKAGCDMVLVCNNRAGALEALNYLETEGRGDINQRSKPRLTKMKGAKRFDILALQQSDRWQSAIKAITH
ncbi:beta-N-acetylhexosaminidase [Alkalimarinus alittae]|uniref:Beta-hexosaminidase n=1 Tax=Alkalimarinus alittae TaxID=2961619 RepID=A0ABY6MY41_9ALTE|nr:beta-N-acetylhexosaminidase [Alkalimarinus alittae]UZE94745.1 beta-N-acetylhexosaminidase [Alkalimarinus alittae]